MKKFTVIVLALILVFAMSTSVFAAGGATDVTVTVDSTQISVTVPVSALTIGAKVNGGPATVPGGYQIVNTSAIPIKVESIAVTMNNANWVFADAAIEAGTASTVTDKNQIFLTVNGMTLAVREAAAPTNATEWNIAADKTLSLPLACSTSQLNTTDTVSNLITITYVISAGSH